MPRIGLVFLSLCLIGCASSTDNSAPAGDIRPTSAPAGDLQRASDAEVALAVDTHNEEVADDKDKVICTREAVVGTHFRRRVCRTIRQIEEDREGARRSIDDEKDFDFDTGPR